MCCQPICWKKVRMTNISPRICLVCLNDLEFLKSCVYCKDRFFLGCFLLFLAFCVSWIAVIMMRMRFLGFFGRPPAHTYSEHNQRISLQGLEHAYWGRVRKQKNIFLRFFSCRGGCFRQFYDFQTTPFTAESKRERKKFENFHFFCPLYQGHLCVKNRKNEM